MRISLVLLLVAVALVLSGCTEQQEVQRPEEKAQQLVSQALNQDKPAAGGARVEVAAEGSKFDPPVQIDQLPSGIWYCDMGTSHYARKDEGDGRCPTCGMNLSHKGGAEDQAAGG